jgi:hypothetical protein
MAELVRATIGRYRTNPIALDVESFRDLQRVLHEPDQ